MGLIANWTDTKIPATGTTSQVFTVPAAVPAGSTIFAAVTVGSSAASMTATDSRGNTWVTANRLTLTGLGCGAMLRSAVTTALQAGDTITIAIPVTTNRWAVVFGVFDDVIIPANSSDAAGVAGSMLTVAVGPTPADVQANSLVVMSCSTTSGGYPYSAPTGFPVASVVTEAATTNRAAGLFYRYESSPSPYLAPTAPITQKVIGATAEFGMWDAVVAGAGEPIFARRHYPILVASGKNKSADIEDSVAHGRMPVISYKPPTLAGQTAPDTAGLLAGTYDAMIAASRDYLLSLNVPLTVSFWHEPHNEITPADYIAGATKFLDIFGDHPNISHGPILNGFLLDSVADTAKFKAFLPESLLARWDFVAADSYQNGTNAAPGTKMPGRVAPALVQALTDLGHPNMPIGVGEYNGLTAAAITDAGETFLSTPTLWFACLWVGVSNSNGVDWTMDTPKWDAYKATKADARAQSAPTQYSGSVNLSGTGNAIGLLEAIETGVQPPSTLPLSIYNGTAEVKIVSAAIWNGTAEVPIKTLART